MLGGLPGSDYGSCDLGENSLRCIYISFYWRKLCGQLKLPSQVVYRLCLFCLKMNYMIQCIWVESRWTLLCYFRSWFQKMDPMFVSLWGKLAGWPNSGSRMAPRLGIQQILVYHLGDTFSHLWFLIWKNGMKRLNLIKLLWESSKTINVRIPSTLPGMH